MGSTDAPAAVTRLAAPSAGELAMLGELVTASHWNQVAADWDLFLSQGSVHVIRDAQGRIIASGAVLPMGNAAPGVAWISMILVLPQVRGAGLGKAVFGACLREIRAMGRIPMLDATPAGEALYTQFGFEPSWRSTRWRRPAPDGKTLAPAVPGEAQRLLQWDAEALGFARAEVLGALARRAGSACHANAGAVALVRAGHVAHQLGPLLAQDGAAAARLLEAVSASVAAPLVADVPDERPAMDEALRRLGFKEERRFARMALLAPGQRAPTGRQAWMHAIAGPEFA